MDLWLSGKYWEGLIVCFGINSGWFLISFESFMNRCILFFNIFDNFMEIVYIVRLLIGSNLYL